MQAMHPYSAQILYFMLPNPTHTQTHTHTDSESVYVYGCSLWVLIFSEVTIKFEFELYFIHPDRSIFWIFFNNYCHQAPVIIGFGLIDISSGLCKLNQTPAIISNLFENGKLSTENRWILPYLSSIWVHVLMPLTLKKIYIVGSWGASQLGGTF